MNDAPQFNSCCKTGALCGKLSCQRCRELVQASFAKVIATLWSELDRLTFVTLIPADGWVDYSDLDSFNLIGFAKRHQKKLRRLFPPDLQVVGAVDVSLIVIDNEVSHWQFHLHLIVAGSVPTETMIRLRSSYPKADNLDILKPVRRDPFGRDDLKDRATYTCKSSFTRRSSYVAKPNSDRNPYRDSRSQSLKRCEQLALFRFFEKYRVTDLLILIGLKRMRTSGPTDIQLKRTGTAKT